MRKAKRLIALLTVALFLLSFAAPTAFAKTGNDAVSRLNALGIVVGYGDGEFKPDQNITRAEYAAIVVQALGLGEAANYVKGSTKFTDVSGSNWASGVINIAVSQKILAGYPDGSFKPEQNVSYNEAITMVVRMLGYADTIDNPVYPTSYVAKAAELNLIDSVVVTDYNAAATRGNVFILADNALDTKLWGLKETKNDGSKVYGELSTLLAVKQKVTESKEGIIEEAGPGFTGLAKDKIVFDNADFNSAQFKWGLATPASEYYGIKAKIYYKDDGTEKKVVAVKPVGSIVSGKIDTVTPATGTVEKIKLFGKGEFSAASTYVYFGAPVKGQFFTLSLNDSGKIVSMINKDFNNADIVKAVNATDKKIEFKKISALELKDVDDKNIEIIKNGKAATFADIKAGDVVAYYGSTKNPVTIYVSDAVVTGKLDSSATVGTASLKFTIAGKAYYSNETGVYYSDDGGDTINAKTTNLATMGSKLVGKDITAKLDAQGNVIYIQAGAVATAADNEVFVRQIYQEGQSGNYTYKIQVTKMDGTATEYVIDNDDYQYTAYESVGGQNGSLSIDLDGGTTVDIAPKMIVKISLDSAGKVDKITKISSGAVIASGVNKDQNYVNITGPISKFADADTKIVKVKKWGNSDADEDFVYEAEVVSWNAGESFAYDELAASKTLVAYYKDAKLKYLYVNSKAAVASGLKPAILTGKAVALGDAKWGITVIEPSKAAATYEVTYAAFDTDTEQAGLTKNVVYLVKFNAEGTKITDIKTTNTPVVDKTVTDVKEYTNVIEVKWGSGDTDYTVISKNAKVFKKTDSGTVEGTISDLSNGKVVDFFNYLDKDDKVKEAPGDIIYDAIYVE